MIGASCCFLANLQWNNFLSACSMLGRPCGKQHHKKSTVPTFKHPLSQMTWRAMSAAGMTVAQIMVAGMTVNGAIYIKVLMEKLQLHMSVHHCKLFMYDGPVVTRVRLLIISWEIKNIRLLDCSRNCPFKSHWQFVDAVKNKLSGKHPTIQKSLATAIKLSWAKEICYEYGNKFVNKIL